MATASAPNHRASLLSGLRTGGVRSTSTPLANVPHTAAPGGSFNVPRFASQHSLIFPEEVEEEDELAEMPSHNMFAGPHGANRQMPMTAAVDGPNNRFSQQQVNGQRGMNPHSVPFSPAFGSNMQAQSAQVQAQAQALQMQMMQLEIMRLQVS